MSFILRLDHHTVYSYASPVFNSYNEARMTPASNETQITLDSKLEIVPAAPAYTYWDYFGTLVHSFDLHTVHDELIIHSSAVVETGLGKSSDLPPPTWSELLDSRLRDDYIEWLLPTHLTQPDEAIVALAEEIRGQAPTPSIAVSTLAGVVSERLTYRKGVTDTTTTASQALSQGAGVCQDHAHVALAALRLLGIPARYASGYFHHHPDAELGEVIVGESHAWVEAWLGDWIGVDPTNGVPVNQWHVLVGRGRDYKDVAPFTGIYNGGPSAKANTEVKLAKLGQGRG
jgi:transglutaminase-like putative cysteine protease